VDQITLEAARRGDRGAQATLLRELQDPWFRLCMGLLGGNQDDARDAVQETALRLLRDLPRFRGDSSVMTWSMGIAINVTREMRRKKRPAEVIDDDTNADLAATQRVASPRPEDHASLKESQSVLHATLKDLPQRQREALMLRYFEELSVEDTAVAMGCATGTVKATVHQALRVLRKKLTQLM
jgi:RNA polymerase sigma-70 factor (ECF subfamily)